MKRSEKGFTLVELMVTTAVTAVILGGIGMGFYHLVTVPDYGNEKITAMHELQNAGHWFCKDGQMAQSASGEKKLTLIFPDASEVRYRLQGRNLLRSSEDGEYVMAQNIEDVSFSFQGRVVTMYLTSAPGGRWGVSENETYQVCLRVDDA